MVNLSTWLHTFLSALEETFPNRVWFVGLQGSYARGEATEASDIDIVVILDELLVQIDKTAVCKAIKSSACNIYHSCVHNMLYEKNDAISVSYTHLDVYKRQISNRGSRLTSILSKEIKRSYVLDISAMCI